MKPTLKQLERQLVSLEAKLSKAKAKHSEAVEKQFYFEDNFDDYSYKAGYQKTIDIQFEQADKIEELERLIKNKKAQIKRKATK